MPIVSIAPTKVSGQQQVSIKHVGLEKPKISLIANNQNHRFEIVYIDATSVLFFNIPIQNSI
jgi:hypothetical protein